MTIVVRPVAGLEELEAALALRDRVFVVEQGVSVAGELDGRDGEAIQLVAVDGTCVVGTCRVLMEGDFAKFGRLVVDASLRGQGIGARLLEAAEREAVAAGARVMGLHAQTAAMRLYERAGYMTRGRRFMDEGIEHIAMYKVFDA